MHVGGHVGSARRPLGVGEEGQAELEPLERALVEGLTAVRTEDLHGAAPERSDRLDLALRL